MLASIPGLARLDHRQLAAHRWSAQFNPLMWCTSSEDDHVALATALRRRGLGTSAADRLRAWWAWRGAPEARPLPLLVSAHQTVDGCDDATT